VAHPFAFSINAPSQLDDTTPANEGRVTGFVFAGARSFGVSKGRGFSVLLPPLTNAQMGVEILRHVYETEGKEDNGRGEWI